VTEDVRDRKLPGGSLLSAYLDRQLMIWSDRGGASRDIGDRWAAHCSEWLSSAIDQQWHMADGETVTIFEVLRLDDIAAVSREANLNHLENPDFLLFGILSSEPDAAVILAADAKFAADRIKPSQVSAQIVENLINVPDTGVTRTLVEQTLETHQKTSSRIEDGSFICPDSTLTEFLLRRASKSRSSASIVRIEPSPSSMFSGLPPSQLIGVLARQDRLPVTPRDNLLSALYYYRVACACMYLWQEQHLPLFSVEQAAPPEIGRISADVARLAESEQSAYSIMMQLVDEAELVQRSRQAVANVASLPLRMAEIRSLLQSVGKEGDKLALRQLRKELELEFRQRLHEQIGEIAADDPRPIGDILDTVASASRGLSDHMREFAVNRAQNLQSTPAAS
jgi:hypothetical protein